MVRNAGDNRLERVANKAFNPPLAHSNERSANDTANDISEGSVGTPNSYTRITGNRARVRERKRIRKKGNPMVHGVDHL